MNGVRVKVCGITRPADAERAATLGAAAVGMIFAPGSPRRLDLDEAREIAAAVGGRAATVGVFADEDPGRVREIVAALGLDYAQLHGNEDPEYCRDLGVPAIKALRVGEGFDAAETRRYDTAGVLLDTRCGNLRGGSGRTFDWSLARGVDATRLVVAGGLAPGNACEAARLLGPRALDVSSGVESRPGVKDHALLEDFFASLETAGLLARGSFLP